MSLTGKSPIQDWLILGESYSSQVQAYVSSAFTAIVWYNAIELLVLCFTTFKRYQGCYFWCLLVASSSLIPHCLGFIFLIFPLGVSPYASLALILVFWCGMVTGHSLVLWSRLHLVVQNPRILRGVFWMIVTNACLLHTPIIVLFYGSISSSRRGFSTGYDIMERIQLVIFCVQELTISGIYIWKTATMLRLGPEHRSRGILVKLLIINVVILMLDLAVVGIEYAGYYAVQVMFKPVAYSIKLKLEYSILGRLVEIARGCSQDLPSSAQESHWRPPVDLDRNGLWARKEERSHRISVDRRTS